MCGVSLAFHDIYMMFILTGMTHAWPICVKAYHFMTYIYDVYANRYDTCLTVMCESLVLYNKQMMFILTDMTHAWQMYV